MVQGGRREEGSGWGTRVYLWRIHVDVWQNQYNIVKLKKKDIITASSEKSECLVHYINQNCKLDLITSTYEI